MKAKDKIIELLPGIFAVEVPHDADEWMLIDVDGKLYLNGITEDGTMYAGTEALPPGNYSILFTWPCSEQQAAGVVGWFALADDKGFRDYSKDYVSYGCNTPKESFRSLLLSQHLNPENKFVIITREK